MTHLQSSNPPRRRTAVVLSLLPILMLLACSDVQPVTAIETMRRAYVAQVELGRPQGLSFVGEVRAARRAELAFAVAGRVASVSVDVGDTVRRGQVLAKLDLHPLSAQLAAAEGELAKAEAQLFELRQRQERVGAAQAGGAVSRAETGFADTEVLAAQATRRIALAQRDMAKWSLAQATLRAPTDGTVAMRQLEPGQVGAGAPVIVIDGHGRELSMLLPGSVLLTPGQAATLRGRGTEQASRVLRVADRLEAGGVRRAFLALPDDAEVGSTWVALLDDSALQATVHVPLRAVLPDTSSGSGRVLRLAQDGRTVEAVEVKLGALHGLQIEVTQGLAAGDKVIVAGAASIRPGSLVRPVAYKGESTEVSP